MPNTGRVLAPFSASFRDRYTRPYSTVSRPIAGPGIPLGEYASGPRGMPPTERRSDRDRERERDRDQQDRSDYMHEARLGAGRADGYEKPYQWAAMPDEKPAVAAAERPPAYFPPVAAFRPSAGAGASAGAAPAPFRFGASHGSLREVTGERGHALRTDRDRLPPPQHLPHLASLLKRTRTEDGRTDEGDDRLQYRKQHVIAVANRPTVKPPAALTAPTQRVEASMRPTRLPHPHAGRRMPSDAALMDRKRDRDRELEQERERERERERVAVAASAALALSTRPARPQAHPSAAIYTSDGQSKRDSMETTPARWQAYASDDRSMGARYDFQDEARSFANQPRHRTSHREWISPCAHVHLHVHTEHLERNPDSGFASVGNARLDMERNHDRRLASTHGPPSEMPNADMVRSAPNSSSMRTPRSPEPFRDDCVVDAAADLVEERSPGKRESITKLLLKSKEYLKAKNLLRNRNNEIDWVATFLSVGFEANSIYSIMCPLRKGRWKVEEEKYTMELLRLIENGTIRLPHGQSIRGFIAKKLHSDDMRVLKKLSNCKIFSFARSITPCISDDGEIDENAPGAAASLQRLEKLKSEFLRSVQLEALVAVRKYLSDSTVRDLLNSSD